MSAPKPPPIMLTPTQRDTLQRMFIQLYDLLYGRHFSISGQKSIEI